MSLGTWAAASLGCHGSRASLWEVQSGAHCSTQTPAGLRFQDFHSSIQTRGQGPASWRAKSWTGLQHWADLDGVWFCLLAVLLGASYLIFLNPPLPL